MRGRAPAPRGAWGWPARGLWALCGACCLGPSSAILPGASPEVTSPTVRDLLLNERRSSHHHRHRGSRDRAPPRGAHLSLAASKASKNNISLAAESSPYYTPPLVPILPSSLLRQRGLGSIADVPEGTAGTPIMRELLANYEASEAPPLNENGVVPVSVAFRANQLLEFDHVEQTLRVQGWLRQYWYDPRLAYDGKPELKGAAAHQGWDSQKDFLTVDSEKLWRPDVTLYNAVDLNWDELCAPSKAFIADKNLGQIKTEKGTQSWNVFWSQPCVLVSRCAAELKWYPFDNNTCELTFSPFTDNFLEMHAAIEKIETTVSVPEFSVHVNAADTTIDKDPFTIVGKPVHWESVTIRMGLLRHGQYYVINFVGPTLLLIMLCWVGFWIPLQASDRVGFNITLLLTLMAVNFITADKRPATHEDMWLDRFQTSSMLMIVGSVFYSVWAYHMQPLDDWPEERKAAQLARLEFREKIARIIFPVGAFGYLGYLFYQLHVYTQEEDYSPTAYVIFVALGIVAVGLFFNALGGETIIARMRGES